MLLWEKFKNTCATLGYSRAASQLASQGHYELAKKLMIEGQKECAHKRDAIKRLSKVKKAKASYEPGDHYMRGKSVAFWKGHADA